MLEKDLVISNLIARSGKEYPLDSLEAGNLQYMDREYKFAYIPEYLKGCLHIKTCGDDKMISENEPCFSFNVNRPVNLYILFADKFPVIPAWLKAYERVRKNVTRQDSDANTLKGYFSLYKKAFPATKIILNGCSPDEMLKEKNISRLKALLSACIRFVLFLPTIDR